MKAGERYRAGSCTQTKNHFYFIIKHAQLPLISVYWLSMREANKVPCYEHIFKLIQELLTNYYKCYRKIILSMLNKHEFSVAILKMYKHMKFPKLIDSKSPCLAICLISCHVKLIQFYSIQLTVFFDIPIILPVC